jgi:PAS domain S-box-containing protein
MTEWTRAPRLRDEHERLRRLGRFGVRPGQRHEVLDQITALAASLVETPVALVSLVTEDQQWFASRHGLDALATGRDESFCGHTIERSRPLAVPDAHDDPRFAANPLVVGGPRVRSYLGIPLFVAPGQSGVGTLCVIDHRPRVFTAQHERDLARLSLIVERYLEDYGVRRAFESSPLSMVTVDEGCLCIRANPAFSKMLGREPSSILDRPLTSFLLPADRGVLSAMVSHALSHDESPTRRELRFLRLNGEVVLGGTSVSALGVPRDQVVCVIRDISLERRNAARSGVIADVRRELAAPLERARATVRALTLTGNPDSGAPILEDLDELDALLEGRIGDIASGVRAEAELVASEQRMRAVMEHAVGMLLVIDDRGRIVDANEHALVALGWTFDELVGASLHEVDPSFSDQECRQWFERALQRPTHGLEREPATLTRRDGRELHVERSALVMDWNGPARLVMLAQDVSAAFAREASLVRERDDLEHRVLAKRASIDALRRVESELKASLSEKDVLLKEIHHRVKNNLQMVTGLLSLQMDQVADPAGRALLAEGVQRVRSMALIHQHLYGTASLERIELGAYARSLAESLRHLLAPGIPLRVEADVVEVDVQRAAPVGLVLNELLTNAFKHGHPPAGAVTNEIDPGVVVRIQRVEDGARIVVRDRGPGLPANFDLRGKSNLGLQLVRALVLQLRGRVSARTDGGAVFELDFPL